jgi:carboxymethylenebutenolidase
MAFAPDGLTSLGGFPGDDYKGGQMFGKINRNKLSEDMVAAAVWLKLRPDCTGKVAATGFCYGGGIANMLAVRLEADLAAAAPFYGSVPATDDIPKIRGRFWFITGSSTRGWRRRGRPTTRLSPRRTFRMKAISTRVPFVVSIAMRPRNATTKLQPI